MTSRTKCGLAGFLFLLAAMSVLDSRPAFAQAKRSQDMTLEDVPLQAPSKVSPWGQVADPQAEGSGEAAATEETAATSSEDDDLAYLDIDWSLLDVDASTILTNPVRLHAVSRAASSEGMTWSSQEKAYGSAVSVKQTVSPFWDTRVGADMTVVRQPATLSELLAEKATNGGNEPQSSGTAWAAVTAPGVGSIWDKTTIEARVDPSQDQGSSELP